MATVECRECEGTVAHGIDKCPHCGAKRPAITQKTQQFAQRILIGIAIALFVLAVIADSIPQRDEGSKRSGQDSDVIDTEMTFDKRAEYYRSRATSPCAKAIEARAKYDFEWTNSFLERQLSHYRPSSRDPEAIVYMGDAIKFQNGFGSWIRHIYACEYNVPDKKVTTLSVSPGRL